MEFLKFLQTILFFVTFAATTYTSVDKCIYGFFAFAIGFTYALLNLTMSRKPQKVDKICNEIQIADLEKQRRRSKVLIALESAHDYIPIGFINMEVHRMFSQASQLSFWFCIPFGLDFLSRLFDDGIAYIADENVLVFLKNFNILLHSLSILSLAAYQYNIWFLCIWLSAMLVMWGVYAENAYSSGWKNLKLFGYIFFYVFAFIGIYDVDFLKRLEWFNIQVDAVN